MNEERNEPMDRDERALDRLTARDALHRHQMAVHDLRMATHHRQWEELHSKNQALLAEATARINSVLNKRRNADV